MRSEFSPKNTSGADILSGNAGAIIRAGIENLANADYASKMTAELYCRMSQELLPSSLPSAFSIPLFENTPLSLDQSQADDEEGQKNGCIGHKHNEEEGGEGDGEGAGSGKNAAEQSCID
jgi:hypothetical protein